MIIRKLKRMDDFTSIEKKIAAYILSHGEKISSMGIRELAKNTYSSSSTISRFCQKVGTSGYSDFKIQFNTEYKENLNHSKEVDENLPFNRNNTSQEIVNSIANINMRAIQESRDLIDSGQIDRIVKKMAACSSIQIYGQGSSLQSAREFKTKMLRMGKLVFIEEDFSSQAYQAANATQNSVAVLISYSGENREVLKIANILKKKHIFIVAITGENDNALSRVATEALHNGTSEVGSLFGKIEIFSSHSATHFIFDCLYACLYKIDFDKNYLNSKRVENTIHETND